MESKPLVKSSNFDDVISRIGFGRYQIALYIVATFRYFFLGTDLVSLSIYQKYLINEEDMSYFNIELIVTLLVLAKSIGFIIGGIESDKVGRLPMLKIAYSVSIISGILSSFFQSTFIFVLFRFFVSVGIGLSISVGPAYLLENCPIHTRGTLGVSTVLLSVVGQGFTLLLAYLFMRDFNGDNWIIVFGAPSFLGVIVTIPLFFYLKESPYFLLRKGKTSEGIEVAEYISQQNTGEGLYKEEIEIATETQPLIQDKLWLNIIFDSNHLNRTLLLMWITSISTIGCVIPFYLFPLLLDGSDFYIGFLLEMVGVITSFVIVMLLIEHKEFGRKRTLTIGYILITVSCSISCGFASGDLFIAIMIGTVSGFASVLYSVSTQFVIEQYETEIRSASHMIINMSTRVFTIPFPIIIAEISINNIYPLILYIFLYASATLSILGIKQDTTGKHLDSEYD